MTISMSLKFEFNDEEIKLECKEKKMESQKISDEDAIKENYILRMKDLMNNYNKDEKILNLEKKLQKLEMKNLNRR